MLILMMGGEVRVVNEESEAYDVDTLELQYDIGEYFYDHSTDFIVQNGVTLYDFFLMIEMYSGLFSEEFSPLIFSYIEELKQTEDPESPILDIRIEWLVVQKNEYVTEFKLLFPTINEQLYRSSRNLDESNNEPFTINNFSLSELKSAKIKLFEEYRVYEYDALKSPGSEEAVHMSPETPYIFSSKKRFSMMSVVIDIISNLCPEVQYDFYEEDEDLMNIEPSPHKASSGIRQSESDASVFEDICRELKDLEENL